MGIIINLFPGPLHFHLPKTTRDSPVNKAGMLIRAFFYLEVANWISSFVGVIVGAKGFS